MNAGRVRRDRSVLRLGALVGILAGFAASAAAQSWTNSAGGNWSVAANWSGGIPASASTTTLNFNTAGTYSSTNAASQSQRFYRLEAGNS